MKLHQSDADLFIPDGSALLPALGRITHLGIGAHPDDLEFMALGAIAHCHYSAAEWFGGVTCTDGAGCPRSGRFSNVTSEQLIGIRREEQRRAAAWKLRRDGATGLHE